MLTANALIGGLALAASVITHTISGTRPSSVSGMFMDLPKGVEAIVVAKDDRKIRMPTSVVLLKPFSGIATNRCFATEYIVCDGCRKVGYGKATRVDTGNDSEMRFSELDVRMMGFSTVGIKCEPGFPWCFHGTKIVCVDGEFVTERRE